MLDEKKKPAPKIQGALWVWGSNSHGAIGVVEQDEAGEVLAEQIEHAKSPRFVRELANISISQVVCGNQFCAILTSGGEVYTWGNGQHGKLGHLDQLDQPLPRKIVSLENVSKIACGQEHMMCLSGGTVFSWGCGIFGRLGHASVKAEPEPREIKALSGLPIENIFCGATSFAVDCRGGLWAWGSASYGQIGNGDRVSEFAIPVPVSLSNVSQIACSERHVIAIVDAKFLYAWGCNNEGQLGTGDLKDCIKPVKITIPSLPGTPVDDLTPVNIACGRAYSAVVTKRGDVYTFGAGDEGELGHGVMRSRTCVPTKVVFEDSTATPIFVKVEQVSCGEGFMMALTNTNQVYSWGTDKSGQLGVGGKFEEEKVQQTVTTHSSTKTAAVVDDFALMIAAMTPKKGKKPRNPASPSKRRAQSSPNKSAQSSSSSSSAPSAVLQTHRLKPILIPWFYGVQQIACGHSHTMALVEYKERMLQVVRDGDFESLKEFIVDSQSYTNFSFVDRHYLTNYNFIHWAVVRNHPKILSHIYPLVEDGVRHSKTGDYKSPLILAALHGHLEIVNILLATSPRVNEQDNLGNTALHYAADLKRIDICGKLILGGADAEIENHKSKKALEYFALQEVFELKKQIKVYDIAIYCADEDLEFSKELKAQVESFHIVCSLNEERQTDAAFIKGSRALIFVLSNFSATTQESLNMVRLARTSKRHVYPIWRQKATMSPALESLIFRNQLVDFTDPAKFVDSTAQLVGGLRNIFEDKAAEAQEDAMTDDSLEVDEAFGKMVEHPNMAILPADLMNPKKNYLYLCHDVGDAKKAALLAASLCEHGFICSYYNEDPHITGDLITNCWTFLLILSSRSAASVLVRDQIALAENRQKLILPVLVQKSKITLDPAMTYTLARVARFPFFIGDKDITACVAKLVEAIRLAKKVSEKSEKLKNLREEVVVANAKMEKSNKFMKEFKAKVEVQTKKKPAAPVPKSGR